MTIRSVSVVVPTFNRLEPLTRLLDAIPDQSASGATIELVVVSDGSTDGTDEYLRKLDRPDLVFVTQANAGPAAARNTALEHASGELIVFFDDDVVPDPVCVAAHVAAHEHAGPDVVVIGPMRTPKDWPLRPWVAWEQAMLVKQYDAMNRGDYRATARQFYTGNASVRADHLRAAGGFDERFTRAEDVDLGYRLQDRGLGFVFDDEATVDHYAERSYRAWKAIAGAYGRNDVVFWRDKHQRWLLPALRSEFGERRRANRTVTRLGVRLPALRHALHAACRLAATLPRFGRSATGQRLFSAAFNLEYYAHLADELDGGFAAFLAVESAAPHRQPAA